MLEELRIKDFQKHQKLRVPLAPGVTCIIGPTEAGKSAILRALRLVCLNRPLGEAFVRNDAREALVELLFDGHKARRVRGKDTNTYRLDDDEYKAFANNVPEPVAQALAMGDLNFQRQLDGPFWFDLSPPEVSRQLNQIVNLGAIDEVLGELGARGRKAAAVVDVARQRHGDAKSNYQRTAALKAVDTALALVEGVKARHTDAARRRMVVTTLLTQARNHELIATRLTAAVTAGDVVLIKAKEAIKQRNAATALRALVRRGLALQTAAGVKVPDISVLRAKMKLAQDKSDNARILRMLTEAAEEKKKQHGLFLFKLDNLKTEINELTGGRCPVCDRPL